MALTARHLSACAIFALLALSSLSAKPLADYQVGDRAEEDIVTPTPLVVIDAEATALLK